MKQTNRIKHLYTCLTTTKYTYNDLLIYFKKMNIIISLRQLQRDLKDLEFFIGKDERLVKSRTFGNAVEFQIIKQTRPESGISIENSVFKTFTNKKNIDSKLTFFNDAIIERKLLKVFELKIDATSFNSEFKDTSFTLLPLKIIYHHNDYYLACYLIKSKTYAIFEINQLKKYTLGRKSTAYNYDKLLFGFSNYAKSLFGVTKNVDDKIYRIKLEFSSLTGTYVESFVWHHSQKFKHQNNKVIMTLKCGINRELLRWIFGWMYNVRIIEPPELKEYYNRALKEIQQINKNKPLVYRNIFN